MSEYLNQFNPSVSAGKPSENLQHYRIQIRKLQQKLKQTTLDYQKRIKDLQGQLKVHRKPIFQNLPASKPNIDLNFQIFQKDNTIKQLKAENTKLRQIINNPDQILIKKQNNFELLTEKDNEINRLKKALIDIESKYDGQFFNEHKIKKEYEMLCKENQSLKLTIRSMETQRKNYDQEMPSEAIESINYKKQFQAASKENQVLKKVILEQEQTAKNFSRVSQRQIKDSNVRKSNAFGMNTQMQEMKLQVEEYKTKNRELQKTVNELTKENEKLLGEKEKMSRFAGRESKKVEDPRVSKVRKVSEEEEDLIKYYQSREVIRNSFVEEASKPEETPRKFGKYYELGIDESYANRLSKVVNPMKPT